MNATKRNAKTAHARSASLGFGAIIALVLGAVATGCSDSGSPDLVGSWEGGGRVALSDGSIVDSPELLIIERQDDELLWGTIEYVDNGEKVIEDIVGTLTDDGDTIVLAESDATWRGEVNGDTIEAVISWTGDEQFGAFAVTLERVED